MVAANLWPWVASTCCVLLVALSGCSRPPLPDDLISLMRLMNSNDETTSVNASNKVSERFGKDGLLRVLEEGELRARARAARWLWPYAAPDVEQALVYVVTTEKDSYLRVQALWSLADMGSENALPVVDKAAAEQDSDVAQMAVKAGEAIRARAEGVHR
jgi:hypothetical protein